MSREVYEAERDRLRAERAQQLAALEQRTRDREAVAYGIANGAAVTIAQIDALTPKDLVDAMTVLDGSLAMRGAFTVASGNDVFFHLLRKAAAAGYKRPATPAY